jgi:DNA invertase Pin-like site-specific DNA recombinase
MLIGYAHVSATDQSPQLQLDALTKEGCTKIFTDTISDAKALAVATERVIPLKVVARWHLSIPSLI